MASAFIYQQILNWIFVREREKLHGVFVDKSTNIPLLVQEF